MPPVDPGKKQTPREFFLANGKSYMPGIGCTVEVLYQAFKGRHEEEMTAKIQAELRSEEISTVTFEVSTDGAGRITMQYWYDDNEGIRVAEFMDADGLDEMINEFKDKDLNIMQVFENVERKPVKH